LWAAPPFLAVLFLAGILFAFGAPRQTAKWKGFAPADQNLLAPLLGLAPPQDPRQALEIFEQIHSLDRKLILHPALSPELQRFFDRLPAPEVIPIEMPTLYASPDIPWAVEPPDIHYIAVGGHPDGREFTYGLAKQADPPEQPGQLGAVLRITPRPPARYRSDSVIAELKVLLYISEVLTAARGMDASVGFQREIYGTLEPPWDKKPGIFNQHDKTALARLRRDLPATSERLDHYLKIRNLLDEFSGPSGPRVLFNLDAEVRLAALEPFPHLHKFWREVAGRVDAQWEIRDESGRLWFLTGFHRGRIATAFMLREGMLAPMNSALQPAGPPLPIEQIRDGRFYIQSTVSAQRFGMRFGMSGIKFLITYSNKRGSISFDGHMIGAPRLVAPPVIHPLTMLLAGEFLDTIAYGNDGLGVATSFAALPAPRGGTMLAWSVGAELRNAPALAMLTRMAATFAPQYGTQVREEQRRLTAEFFDALESDYRRARPVLLGGSEPVEYGTH